MNPNLWHFNYENEVDLATGMTSEPDFNGVIMSSAPPLDASYHHAGGGLLPTQLGHVLDTTAAFDSSAATLTNAYPNSSSEHQIVVHVNNTEPVSSISNPRHPIPRLQRQTPPYAVDQSPNAPAIQSAPVSTEAPTTSWKICTRDGCTHNLNRGEFPNPSAAK